VEQGSDQDTEAAVLSCPPVMPLKSRNLMAADTEPADEELVMREAPNLAVQRRAIADAWVAARRREAFIFGASNTQARRTDKLNTSFPTLLRRTSSGAR
jgi:hypothetical protein